MTEKSGIIFLQKDKFQLYSPYLSNILEFRFVSEISLDFDLFNKPIFESLVRTFVVNNKIPEGSFIIIVADNASFIKDFALTQTASGASTIKDLQTQANEFIDHVPFEEVAGKTYPLANGVRAYATNKEMFEGIKSALEKQGFIIEMVIPGFIFGQEVSAAPILNINIINIIFQKINLLKEYNLLKTNPLPEEIISPGEAEEKESQPEEVSTKEKKESKNLVLIIGVAIIFLIFIITAIVLYLQFQEKPYKLPVNQSVAKPIITPQIVAQSFTNPSVSVADLSAQIIIASQSAIVANVRSILEKHGFKSIDIKTQQNLGASSSLLIFSKRVGDEIKNSIVSDIREIIPEILVQEKNDSSFDLVIIAGR